MEPELPVDVTDFIYSITNDLQVHRSKTPAQLDAMFQRAYRLCRKYDADGYKKRCQEK